MSITPTRLTALLSAFALFTTTVPLFAAAPRAHANAGSDVFYIDLLKGSDAYNQYGEQALLQEGHKVCDAIQHGASEDGATGIVQSDLGASASVAFSVVSSVELGLDCFSLKVLGM
jgi:hypothetical protein